MTASEFNEWYPVGTPVIYVEDDGSELVTSTRSEAWTVSGTPIVKIKGRPGGHDVSRIKVLESHK